MRTREEHFVLVGYGEHRTQGTAFVASFDGRDRWLRALKALGVLWGLAIVAVFIPLAHFILVPSFAVAGVVVFAGRLRTAETVTLVRGTCPDCATEREFDTTGRWSVPRSLGCTACGRGLTATAPD